MRKKKNEKSFRGRIDRILVAFEKRNAIDAYNQNNQDIWDTKFPSKACHEGNVKILEIEGGGNLYIGGWTRKADDKGMVVVDFSQSTSPKHVYRLTPDGFDNVLTTWQEEENELPWLSVYIKDFGVPVYNRAFWVALAKDVRGYLYDGKNVLLACTGGHGRSGMGAAILVHLIAPEVVEKDPITYVREVHCSKAVETRDQVDYVLRMLDLQDVVDAKSLYPPETYSWKGGKDYKSYKANTSIVPVGDSKWHKKKKGGGQKEVDEDVIDAEYGGYSLPGWSEV